MRVVTDDDGRQYLLVKRSSEAWLVRDPETGRETYRPAGELTVVDEPPLSVAAAGVPAAVRRVVTATHSESALGLLVELSDRGPIAVRALLAATELCESDLHGLVGELRAAGLVKETAVGGERGYDATPTTRDVVARLRGRGDASEDDRSRSTDGREDASSDA